MIARLRNRLAWKRAQTIVVYPQVFTAAQTGQQMRTEWSPEQVSAV